MKFRPAWWLVQLLKILPQAALSRAFGCLARLERPCWLVQLLKKGFKQFAQIDLQEAEETQLRAYPSVEALFIRRLRRGARPLAQEPLALLSPVDGRVSAWGKINHGRLLQVKGQDYSVQELLGERREAKKFLQGDFITLYLSPQDYHRVHTPVAGYVEAAHLLPGRLLPVFPTSLRCVKDLFARNERLITYLQTENAGLVAVVQVGATLVGRMQVSYDPTLLSNQQGEQERYLRYAEPPYLARGDELGIFSLGSTVIILTEPGRVVWRPLTSDEKVSVGASLGQIFPI